MLNIDVSEYEARLSVTTEYTEYGLQVLITTPPHCLHLLFAAHPLFMSSGLN